MKKFLLCPATFKLDGGAMFGIIPKPLWEKKIKPDDFNRILMSLRVVYIETENKKILIDTGIGDYHDEKFVKNFDIQGEKNPIENILKANFTISAPDITDVILTHLHFDHVGGLGSDPENLIFPNAKLHLHKKHHEYALNPTSRDKGSFQSHFFKKIIEKYIEKDQVNFLTEDSGTILKDGEDVIDFRISKGHTPYMIHPVFDQYIYMADLVPMSHHIKTPWVMGYDIEPGITTVYKEIFYKEILEKNWAMIFEHDLEHYGGKIKVNEKSQFVEKELYQSSKDVIELH